MPFSKFERFIAFRYLLSPRQEGFVSIVAGFSFLGIMLGVATLIIVMSVMNGFREELLNKITGIKGHFFVYHPQKPLLDYKNILLELENAPYIKSIYPIIERQGILFGKKQARGVSIHAMRQKDIKQRSIIFNKLYGKELKDFKGNALFIGIRLAETMHLNVGDNISLLLPESHSTAFGTLPNQKRFIIHGIFDAGVYDFDKNVVIMPLETAQEIFHIENSISHIEVFAKDLDKSDEILNSLKNIIKDRAHVLDWQHSDLQIFHAVQVERNVMFLILTLIILIASFNIISSLVMLVKDKTQAIGILRTIGASRASIMRIFLLAGATIGTIGTTIGAILGLTFALNIEKIRQLLQKLIGTELFSAEIYFLSQLPAKVNIYDVLSIVVLSLSLSLLATIYPAWRAASLDPSKALRFGTS
ncbi:MAG: lipoprotein-releasing ABC transporter permease subunit [Alphaproteobacteria bacterium]